ncbi:MAG: hypothetical protein WHV28_05290 [Bacteroidota bacterium]
MIASTKVSRVALENAASVASLMLTRETTIVEKPEKEKTNATNASRYGLLIEKPPLA